jgi:CDP-paratose 2-epimerase
MTFDRLRPVLITGGAGFIGTNLADRLLVAGQPVLVYDNLSRAGVEENLAWLRRKHGTACQVVVGDVRDPGPLRRVLERCCRVFHLAAQVAVTTSLDDPSHDFAVNAGGTLNLLEAIRASAHRPPLLFTSTNKVYGTLAQVALQEAEGRYAPADPILRRTGVGEDQPLDFHSPYGCSKGAADQYVLDYARVYGLRTVVFRMSCIYGPRQRGTEDQGWVAHFLLRVLAGAPLVIYGDGRQVRDTLYVDDLVEAMLLAQARIGSLSGRAFNVGGGPGNAVSLLELLRLMEQLEARRPDLRFAPWRPADQRYYVSCNDAFARETGWRPRVSVATGVARLHQELRALQIPASRPVAVASLAESAQ